MRVSTLWGYSINRLRKIPGDHRKTFDVRRDVGQNCQKALIETLQSFMPVNKHFMKYLKGKCQGIKPEKQNQLFSVTNIK